MCASDGGRTPGCRRVVPAPRVRGCERIRRNRALDTETISAKMSIGALAPRCSSVLRNWSVRPPHACVISRNHNRQRQEPQRRALCSKAYLRNAAPWVYLCMMSSQLHAKLRVAKLHTIVEYQLLAPSCENAFLKTLQLCSYKNPALDQHRSLCLNTNKNTAFSIYYYTIIRDYKMHIYKYV